MQLDLLLFHLHYQKCMETRKPPNTTTTIGASSSSNIEKRTETQEAISVKKRLTTKSSTEERTATFADKPVERRLMVKTDTENYDLLMPLESVGSPPLNTASTLFSDETGVETNPWNDDFGQTKILTILDDPKEVN